MESLERRGASRASWFAAAVLLSAFGTCDAAGTGQLVVSATVLSKGTCHFRSTPATLAFGTINPASTGAATAATSLVVRCSGSGGSSTVTYSLTAGNGLYPLGAGLRRMRHATNTTAYMAYALSFSPAGATIPKGQDFTIAVSGTVAPADFQDAAAGAYSDTVVLDLNP